MKRSFISKFIFSTLFLFLCHLNNLAQINFTLAASACAGSTQTLSIISGSNSVLSNTWAALPFGPVFSAPNSTLTSVTFPTSGTFTVAVAAITSGGIAYTTNTITIQAAPSITLSQSSLTTCIISNFPGYSKPIHLTASGASNYTWFPIQPTPPLPSNGATIDVKPISSTNYTVLGNTGGCESTATINVFVIPQFSLVVYPKPAVRCMPDSLNLSITNISGSPAGSSSAWTYSWSENPGSSTITLSSYFTHTVLAYPTNATTYTVEMRDSTGCISLPEIVNVTLQTCTGLSHLSEINSIKIFPNPAKDYLNWNLESENIRLEKLCIVNVLGQTVLTIHDPSAKGKTDLSSLSPGVYFVNLNGPDGQKLMKFIKE